MAREEVALRRALFVTVIGTRPVVLGSNVLEEVDRRYCLNIDDMSIHQTMSEDFLLFLPDEEVVTRVLNEGRPFRGPMFSLVFKQWTRFTHTSATSLPHLMDIEICGTPAHAWGLTTAKELLHDSCHILELHPASASKSDLSSLKLRAWCLDPMKLRRDMDLHIIERGPFNQEARCLTYKISIAVLSAPLQFLPESSLSPSDEDELHGEELHGEEDEDVWGQSNPRIRQLGPLQRQSVHLRLGSHQRAGRERTADVHGDMVEAPVLALEGGAALCVGDDSLTSPRSSSPQRRSLAEPLEKAGLSSPRFATQVPSMTTSKNILEDLSPRCHDHDPVVPGAVLSVQDDLGFNVPGEAISTESINGVRALEVVPVVPSVEKINNPQVLSSLGRPGLAGPYGPTTAGSPDFVLPVSP
jgi:hypothetical protein